VADRKSPYKTGNDLNALIYEVMSDLCHHVRVDTANRRIHRSSPNFELPRNDFSYLNLDGDVVSGLAQTLDTINRFDVRQQKMLGQFKISGLPQSIQETWGTPFQRIISFNLVGN
jgi:hypothetical protein